MSRRDLINLFAEGINSCPLDAAILFLCCGPGFLICRGVKFVYGNLRILVPPPRLKTNQLERHRPSATGIAPRGKILKVLSRKLILPFLIYMHPVIKRIIWMQIRKEEK